MQLILILLPYVHLMLCFKMFYLRLCRSLFLHLMTLGQKFSIRADAQESIVRHSILLRCQDRKWEQSKDAMESSCYVADLCNSWYIFRLSALDLQLALEFGMTTYEFSQNVSRLRQVTCTFVHNYHSKSDHPIFGLIAGEEVHMMTVSQVVQVGQVENSIEVIEDIMLGNTHCFEAVVQVPGTRVSPEKHVLYQDDKSELIPFFTSDVSVSVGELVQNVSEESPSDSDAHLVLISNEVSGSRRERELKIGKTLIVRRLIMESCDGIDPDLVSCISKYIGIIEEETGVEVDCSRTLVCELCGVARDEFASIPEEHISHKVKLAWYKAVKGDGCRCHFGRARFVPKELFGTYTNICPQCKVVECPGGDRDCHRCGTAYHRSTKGCGGCYYCKVVAQHQCNDIVGPNTLHYPLRNYRRAKCDCKTGSKNFKFTFGNLVRTKYKEYRERCRRDQEKKPVWKTSEKDLKKKFICGVSEEFVCSPKKEGFYDLVD